MGTIHLLIVDDNEQDLRICRDSLNRYIDENHCNIILYEARSVEDAFNKINSTLDGAIIDLKLAGRGDEGSQVVQKIADSLFRIPVIIFTGTPDNVNEEFVYLEVFKKGETQYETIFDKFREIHDTGLTKIMGGRGIIEETLNQVFTKNLIKQKNAWISYGKRNPEKTERALLRHTLHHLLQLLDQDEDTFFPEEVYFAPPLTDNLKTGSIVIRKDDKQKFVVLNPACDLVVRNGGNIKAERILLVEIDDASLIAEVHGRQRRTIREAQNIINKCRYHNSESESYKLVLKYQDDDMRNKISRIFRNVHDLYHHWLPKTDFFDGGFINFRKVTSVEKKQFNQKFNQPEIQISDSFIKDIVGRFSSYYARQGQPDIECDQIIEDILQK
jgi:hypothetical protein